jgi:predicted enzyme related to lactoylglutathione lyase
MVSSVPAAISGLAGVLIWTSAERFSAMRDFYVEALGLVPRTERSDFVNFAWGSARLSIGVHDQVGDVSGDPLRIMVNFAVDDLDDFHNRMETAGVPCLRRPSPEPWGGRVATYSDPDGNVIQLLTGTS